MKQPEREKATATPDTADELSLPPPALDMSLAEGVFHSLGAALRSGALKPGDRLREEDIARLLGVSRTPVREALGRLVAKGVAVPVGGRGLIVKRLAAAEILELYGMREILEGAAAGLAARHATEPEIAALRDLELAFEASAQAPLEMERINRLFHETVFRAARNRYLDEALRELQDAIALLGATTFTVSDRPLSAAREHRDIIAAIAAHDAPAAEALARAHIGGALRARLQLLHV